MVDLAELNNFIPNKKRLTVTHKNAKTNLKMIYYLREETETFGGEMGYAMKVLIDRLPEGKVSSGDGGGSGGLGEEADTAADEGSAVGEGVWGGVEVEA